MSLKKAFFKRTVKLLLYLFLLFNFSILHAKEKKWEQTIHGSQINTSATMVILDPELSAGGNYVSLRRNTFIELKIDNYMGPYYWYECAVSLSITPILNNGSYGTPYTKLLKVENNHNGNFGNFIDLQKHLIPLGGAGAEISITAINVMNIDTTTPESVIPNNVQLTLSFETERYYDMDPSVIPILMPIATPNISDNTLTFSWAEIPEAEEYELEWTWVDNYSAVLGTPLLTTDIPMTERDFEFNNTRIQTTSTAFTIPLVYDRGYIIYRVRPIGRYLTSTNDKYEGLWSTDGYTLLKISSWAPYIFTLTTSHNNLNWQFQASYAEDGKKKEVVSYFDGSLRNRQTVTKINSNDKTIVGEVIYDEEGRAAVEVLPAPIEDKAIKYYPNLNKNLSNKVYSYQDLYPLNPLDCNIAAGGMNNNSGASKYYSDNNAVQGNFQDFVPEAENYPFSQIDYVLDNTGRVKRKGGVGEKYQLGTVSNPRHEMKYFYTIPTQPELNRLFGYSVGNVTHYKKNIVIDPNGQASVSYLDPQGRTVATSLVSNSPQNMIPLEESSSSLPMHTRIFTDLLNKLNEDDFNTDLDYNQKFLSTAYWGNFIDGLRYDAQKVFIESGDYDFKYKLEKENAFAMICGEGTYYYPFIYKLKLDVMNECGEKVNNTVIPPGVNNLPITDDPATTEIESGIQLGTYTVIPDNPATPAEDETGIELVTSTDGTFFNPTNALTFQIVDPPVGVYGVSKELVVDQDALELFANDYIRRGRIDGCILGPEAPAANTVGCYYTCEQCVAYYTNVPYTDSHNGVHQPFTFTVGTTVYYAQDAYVQSMLASNEALLALADNPGTGSQQYEELLGLLTIRYKREWELLLIECNRPCQDGTPLTGNNTSSVFCDNSLNIIKNDMSPSGQYGVYTDDMNGEGEVTLPGGDNVPDLNGPLTVYNDSSTSNLIYSVVAGIDPDDHNWRNPHFYDIDNIIPILYPPGPITNANYQHYFNQLGEIDYALITWDATNNTFNPPLIPTLNSLPVNATYIQTIDAEAGLYKVEPQYLGDVRDFMQLIATKDTWLLSLVKYHPEFHYLNYQQNSCKTTMVADDFDVTGSSALDSVTLNSDGFDSLIGSIGTYADAKDSHFLDNALIMFDNDPFFQSLHVNDGTTLNISSTITEVLNIPLSKDMLYLKRQIMAQALTKALPPSNNTNTTPVVALSPISGVSFSNLADGYEDTQSTIAQRVFINVFCTAPGPPPTAQCSFIATTPTFAAIINHLDTASGITPQQRDRFWQYYVSYYLGLKQKIQYSFISLHAARMGFYNDCIGDGAEDYNSITNVLNNYPNARNVVASWIQVPTPTLLTENGALLVGKIKRFLPYDQSYNSGESPEEVYANTMGYINSTAYTNDGRCPKVKDLELFLNNAVANADMNPVFSGAPSGSYTQPLINYITPAFLQAMGGSYTTPLSISSVVSGNTLTINFAGLSPITLTLPSGFIPSHNWTTYSGSGGAWQITGMSNLTYVSNAAGVYTFQVIARITGLAVAGSVPGNSSLLIPFRDIILTGTTTVPLTCGFPTDVVGCTNCGEPEIIDPGNVAGCNKKALFAADLKAIILNLQQTGHINDSSYIINPVPAFLSTYLGLQPGEIVRWEGGTGGSSYSLYVNTLLRFSLMIDTTVLGGGWLSNPLNSISVGSLFSDIGQSASGSILSGHHISLQLTVAGNLTTITGDIYSGARSGILTFQCCSTCGEWDFDGDGIADDGYFGQTYCDPCDDRIDANNNGRPDCMEGCTVVNDSDCDGVIDANDICPGYNDNNDFDSDGLPDGCDNCYMLANPTQVNSDSDNLGDACDNCDLHYNPDQLDSDNDGIGNVCDPTPFPIEPTCFSQLDTAEVVEFQNNLKTVLNDIVQSTLPANDYSYNVTIPSIANFVTNCDLEIRFHGIYMFYYSLPLTFTNYTVQLLQNRFPKDLRFNISTLQPYFRLNHFNNEPGVTDDPANIMSDDPLSSIQYPIQSITSITNVTLEDDLNIDSFGQPVTIKGMGTTVNGSMPFTLHLNLKAMGKFAEMSYFVAAPDLCTFLEYHSGNVPAQKAVASRKPHNRISRANVKITTCDCIPQQPLLASGDAMYIAYVNLDLPGKPEYTYQEFIDLNLQFITQGYIDYINSFPDLEVAGDEHYITITQFGGTGLNYGYSNYAAVIAAYVNYVNSGIPIQLVQGENSTLIDSWQTFVIYYLQQNPAICPPVPMTPHITIIPPVTNNCEDFALSVAESYNVEAYAAYINEKKRIFKKAYLDKAINEVVENYSLTNYDKEYQYTLYYYDQSGNLIQTVAPKGVDRLSLSQAQNDQINLARANDTENALLPAHDFKTKYRYNSLNQLIWQSTPDGGETRFAYDDLGRIVASQNDKQKNTTLDTDVVLTFQTSSMLSMSTLSDFVYKSGSNSNAWTASGALSTSANMISSGQRGFAEHTIRINSSSDIDKTEQIVFGLSYSPGTYNSAQVDYGFYYGDDGAFSIMMGSTLIAQSGTIMNGDKLKVERTNGFIKFYQNSLLLLSVYENPMNTSYDMKLDLGIKNTDSRVYDIKMGIYNVPRFSYTCYDSLGRITEAGEFNLAPTLLAGIDENGKLMNLTTNMPISVSAIANSIANSFPHNISPSQNEVTKTLYDDYGTFVADDYLTPVTVRNTQNRVTVILTFDTANQNTGLEDNETAIFYNYDIHGNVDEMAQRISPTILDVGLLTTDGVIKKVKYEYDLISGNVNKVIYQDGADDLFMHRYNYDADNRITSVETSNNGVVWEKDASYEYYEHGPLARVITGDKKVQGTDYAYTLQGWIKTVNSENLVTTLKDMGGDGNHVSKDAYGYSLSYYNNDYTARQPGTNEAHILSNSGNSQFQGTQLFNGNINRMITSVRGLDEEILPTQVNLYRYDQLNRIFGMISEAATEKTAEINSTPSYNSSYSYDKNGNLKTLEREVSNLEMDDFKYTYAPYTNKLTHIDDDLTLTGNYASDIDDQANNNYQYDEIGQLIKDNAEHISEIEWRVDGKVKKIEKYNGGQYIRFFYDGLGNRVVKTVENGRLGGTTTHYSRDAQSNVMGVYDMGFGPLPTSYHLKEHHLYGSSRLGIQERIEYKSYDYDRLVGDKRYELTNHLGNVLNVVSDRKIINSNFRIAYTDFFEEGKPWKPFNEATVNLTEQGEQQIDMNGIESGCVQDFYFNSGLIFFQFKITRLAGFPANTPITFAIRDSSGSTVLWSTIVPASGFVSASFEFPTAGPYLLTVTADITGTASFTMDDFYAYSTTTSETDYVSLFKPDILAFNDYFPFGSLIPGHFGSIGSNVYRYGFNGKEKDDEIKGEGNSYDYGFRMHDPRVGRFLSIDPLFKGFPWFTPYQFSGNSPISCVDLDGLEMYFSADGSFLGQSKKGGSEIKIATSYTTYKTKKGVLEYIIKKSTPINQFDLQTQGKVYQTIYDREIGGKAKINATTKDEDGQPLSGGTGAYTTEPLGAKPINVNVNFYEEKYNSATGKSEYGIGNRDYYSALTNIKHENHHFVDKIGDNLGFDHMKVWAATWKDIKKDGTYSRLNPLYKNYLLSVGAGYIADMEFALARRNKVSKEDFDYAYDLYVENVKLYNSLTGEKQTISSKKDIITVRKENSE